MGSERISGLSDYSHMTVSRNCGGSHTVNSASQRRQSTRHHTHAEVDLALQVGGISFIVLLIVKSKDARKRVLLLSGDACSV